MSMSLANFLMAVYYIGLQLSSVTNNHIILQYQAWFKSTSCHLLMIISTLSVEMSIFMLVFLMSFYSSSVGSYSCLNRLKKSHFMLILLFGWIVIPMLTMTHIITSNERQTRASPPLCMLYDTGTWSNSSQNYIASFFMFLNLISSCCCGFLLYKFLDVINQNEQTVKTMGKTFGRRSQKGSMYLTLMVNINVVSWTTANCFMVLPMVYSAFPSSVINWAVFLILPLPAWTNPLLHTIRTVVIKLYRDSVTNTQQSETWKTMTR